MTEGKRIPLAGTSIVRQALEDAIEAARKEARREAMEEAARIVDRLADDASEMGMSLIRDGHRGRGGDYLWDASARRECAAAIRAAMEKESDPCPSTCPKCYPKSMEKEASDAE